MANTNTKQVLTQIQSALVAATWTGGSNVIFPSNSVVITRITPYTTAAAVLRLRPPICMIGLGDAGIDPEYGEELGLVERDVTFRVIQVVHDDGIGSNNLMDGNVADTTKSEGQGLLSIEEEMFNNAWFLDQNDSINIQYRSEGVREVAIEEGRNHVSYVDHHFKLLTTMSAG